MSKYVDAMLIINNQRLNEIYPDLNVINAFGKADDTLTTAARSIAELITWEDVHIRLDFNDVDTTLRNGGAAIISTGYGEGENRVTKAIQDALNSPLLKNRDVLSSKKLLFNIYINPDMDFKMEETDELTSFISSIDTDVDIIWGMYYDRTLENRVKMTILATGFEITINDTKDNTRPHSSAARKTKSTSARTRIQPTPPNAYARNTATRPWPAWSSRRPKPSLSSSHPRRWTTTALSRLSRRVRPTTATPTPPTKSAR